MQTLEKQLREKALHLTRSQRKLLEYVLSNDDEAGDILTKRRQSDIRNIDETLKQVSVQEFRAFVKSIESAERIIIVGLRSVHSLAVFLGVALDFLQKNVWVIQPGIGDMWDRLIGLKKGDVVIGISFPRYTKQTVEVLRFAKQKGVKTLAVT